MILMIKQLFDKNNDLEKLELPHSDFMQLQQIKDFQPDILVGTCSEDSLQVLQLAMQLKISYAVFEPDLKQLEVLLKQSFANEFLHCGKIIYLKSEDQSLFEEVDHVFYSYKRSALWMFKGDYMKACEQMAFDAIYWGVDVIS